ncbi:DHA2 family efflux MFS transporter permease subunit [Gryllotalpicola protaetiae]|uniref:DHA2 family efflux MFS transporter permease subunit n=1 Tax=Gryllotalpicola protaetiae TaxID=2419771 RepID=A0A387BF04_9MICO|nr:DHA2 family efflux MFS transporter permease subunit [Gryllotalpicola protaetiae]AYG02565.1 DHA2 family efflux MFS transporter permease subunit [Gryllotalpicola protaetiae]
MTLTAQAPAGIDARSSRVIWLLLGATFVVILNETIMGVAIPHLVVDLHVSVELAQWLTTVFMLTMAVVIPVTGWLLQRLETRPAFILAMSFFSAGTLLAAVAPGFTVLLIARVTQACGTAIMMPLLMTTIMELVPPHERGRLMGRVSTVISVAPAIGPTISGLVLNYLSWRWMFLIVLPIAVAMLVIGILSVENVSPPEPAPLDALSIPLAALGFGGLVFGLAQIGGATDASGGSSADVWVMAVALAVGAVSLVLFVLRQRRLGRHERALLDLRPFAVRNFTVSVALMVVMMVAFFGTIIVLPIYMQTVLGFDSLLSGLLLLPGGLVMGLFAPLVGRIYDRRGPAVLLVPGAVIVSLDLWFLALFATEHTSVWVVLAAHIVLSFGLSLMFTPLFTAALGSVTKHFYSHASAIVGTVQQVAGAIGTAVFVAVLAAVTLSAANGGAAAQPAQAAGVRAAFLIGAIVSLGAVAGAFFVRRPAEEVS